MISIMPKLLLSPDDIVDLWSIQPTGPYKRWSKWVFENIWIVPIIIWLPLVVSNFEIHTVVLCIAAGGFTFVYGLVTAAICAPWKKKTKTLD
jgi:hypothetical protein